MKKKQAFRKMKTDLQLRGLSTSTQQIYLKNAKAFVKFADVSIKKLNEDKARDFLSYLINKRNLAAKTVNTYSAAIRFFFAVTLNRPMNLSSNPINEDSKTITSYSNPRRDSKIN